MTDLFNSREIAIGIWLLVLFCYAALHSTVRVAFVGLWKAFCRRQILVSLGLIAGYIISTIIGLFQVGVWDLGQFKNTILWSLSVAIVSLFRISQMIEDDHYFRNALKDNFKLIAIFEFVVTFYTFPLLVELILVAVVAILVVMQAYTEGKKEYSNLTRLVDYLLTVFGGSLVVYAFYMLVVDSGSFFQVKTLTDFGLPIALTLLFFPFLFVLALYVNYENVFLRINLIYKQPPLRRYAKHTALVGFHVRIALLKRWIFLIQSIRPDNPKSLKASMRQVKLYASREKIPPTVSYSEGWSPFLACKFLKSKGVVTGYYHPDASDQKQWFASSRYLEVNNRLFPNHIEYYIEGDEFVAHTLKLVANFDDLEVARHTRNCFADLTEELVWNALKQDIPSELREAIDVGTPKRLMLAGKIAVLEKETWPNKCGYELRFYLRSEHDN